MVDAAFANESGIDTINAFFDSAVVGRIKAKYGAADFVTSPRIASSTVSREPGSKPSLDGSIDAACGETGTD